MTKRIFLSWSGRIGQQLAEGLRSTILSHPSLEVFVSSQDIAAGALWFESIEEALADVDHGLACLGSGASSMPWVNFEAGYIFGRLRNFKLLLFDEQLTLPLSAIQARKGTDDRVLLELLQELTGDKDSAQKWFKIHKAAWHKILQSVKDEPIRKLDDALGDLVRTAVKLRSNPTLHKRSGFRNVVIHSLRTSAARLAEAERGASLTIPSDRYPHYLAHLQDEYEASVAAVALVDHREYFWKNEIGRRVLSSSAPGRTRRVFVFWKPDQVSEYLEVLVQHASRYPTWVTSFERLSKEFPDFAKDFSVIQMGSDLLYAEYHQRGTNPMIQFSSERRTIDRHLNAFEKITSISEKLHEDAQVDFASLSERVFSGRTLQPVDSRPVEMSSYISIPDYDEHEEEHAYFVEMLERMVDYIRQLMRGREHLDVLEFGAGTGHLTRRLARIDSISILALELDWHCYNYLKHRLAGLLTDEQRKRVSILNEDSRRHNPSGTYDIVCSSFADHHIKRGDKAEYFRNVRKNLARGGLFVVGDEFLPEHDGSDPDERHRALQTYHGHIIELAEQAGQEMLVRLESDALESGLNEKGDYKVSCSQYEQMLLQAGFSFQRERVGPAADLGVGGVYIYRMQVQ